MFRGEQEPYEHSSAPAHQVTDSDSSGLATNRYDQRDVLSVIGGPIFDRHQGSSRDVAFQLRVLTYDKVHHLFVVPVYLQRERCA
jgi:hypothetical protein